DGVQVVERPDKQTGGDQDEKRDRDLGDHQNLLRAAARCAPGLTRGDFSIMLIGSGLPTTKEVNRTQARFSVWMR
ncbi:MAG: hypothetical protein ABSH24_08035, partial [Bryobacteraceae bacterium]